MQEQDVRFYPILEAAQMSLRHRVTWLLKGGLKDSGSLKNGQLRPAHMLDTATLGASICPWRALCPAMRYMRLAIAQYLVHMCPDDVGASDEQRAASAIGTLRLAPNDINCLLDNLSLSEFQGMCGDISMCGDIFRVCAETSARLLYVVTLSQEFRPSGVTHSGRLTSFIRKPSRTLSLRSPLV